MKKTSFRRLGLMLDMSRNAVMKPQALKEFIEKTAKMGYNFMMLYTEDTYEIPEEPYFGHMRGRYSQKELKDIVRFAEERGMEMIPCIQTLAHLDAIFQWKTYGRVWDTANILLAEEEKTYALIEKMFRSVKRCFHSKEIHIGMDEAHMVGLGKYLDRFGFQNRFGILSRHLARVCKMAKEMGLEPVMWSDMFFRLANHGKYNNGYKPAVPDPKKLNLPENISLTYWDYYTTDVENYTAMLRAHKELERPIWFAGGIWSWPGFSPDNEFSVRAARAAVTACKNEGVENVMFTLWGDDGGECLRATTLSAVFAAARFAHGVWDMDVIKKEFEEGFYLPFDAFRLFDLHEDRTEKDARGAVSNPEKYLFYNDPFLGLCDSTLKGGENEYYKGEAEKLLQYGHHPEFGIFFRAYGLLAKVLSYKAELGLCTRKLYQAGDKEGMKALLSQYDVCIEALNEFFGAYRAAWMAENKPFGFEVQEIRLGGLMRRLTSCRERLWDWMENNTEIEELEEEMLDLEGGGKEFTHSESPYPAYPLWRKAVSPGIIFHK